MWLVARAFRSSCRADLCKLIESVPHVMVQSVACAMGNWSFLGILVR